MVLVGPGGAWGFPRGGTTREDPTGAGALGVPLGVPQGRTPQGQGPGVFPCGVQQGKTPQGQGPGVFPGGYHRGRGLGALGVPQRGTTGEGDPWSPLRWSVSILRLEVLRGVP